MSRQTAAAHVVEAHEQIGAGVVTGIEFDPPTQDAYKRMAVNCDRIYRWLDDATKETNHLSANMLPSVLAALPVADRVRVMDDILRPVGLSCRAIEADAFDPNATVMLFKGLAKSGSAATAAMADLLDGVDPGELEAAESAIKEAQRQNDSALKRIEAKLMASFRNREKKA